MSNNKREVVRQSISDRFWWSVRGEARPEENTIIAEGFEDTLEAAQAKAAADQKGHWVEQVPGVWLLKETPAAAPEERTWTCPSCDTGYHERCRGGDCDCCGKR